MDGSEKQDGYTMRFMRQWGEGLEIEFFSILILLHD